MEAAGLDREAIIQVVYNGLFAPVVQANPQSSPYYIQELKPPPRDPDKAVQAKLEQLQDLTGAQRRLRNKLWTGIKAGR